MLFLFHLILMIHALYILLLGGIENNSGRFQSGRGSGFRNEWGRGRGNYSGGRGFSRVEFNGRMSLSTGLIIEEDIQIATDTRELRT